MQYTHTHTDLASVVRESRRSRDESRRRASFLTSGLPGEESTCASSLPVETDEEEEEIEVLEADTGADDAADFDEGADLLPDDADASVEAAAAAMPADLAATARATAPT